MQQLPSLIGALPLAGLASFAIEVSRRGDVNRVNILSDTTRVPAADERHRARAIRGVRRAIGDWRFGPQRAPSRITLPLTFVR
jgi:hypothetical protein